MKDSFSPLDTLIMKTKKKMSPKKSCETCGGQLGRGLGLPPCDTCVYRLRDNWYPKNDNITVFTQQALDLPPGEKQ